MKTIETIGIETVAKANGYGKIIEKEIKNLESYKNSKNLDAYISYLEGRVLDLTYEVAFKDNRNKSLQKLVVELKEDIRGMGNGKKKNV